VCQRDAGRRGGAVQVGPIKSKLKSPGTKRLKLQCDEPLSSFALKFNMRRYSVAFPALRRLDAQHCSSSLDQVRRCSLTLSNPC